jgi:hypothetical protein
VLFKIVMALNFHSEIPVTFLFVSTFNPLKSSGTYMYLYAASTISNSAFCAYGFCMILSVNRDYFLKHNWHVDFCNGEVWCFLYGIDWIFKYYLDEFQLQWVKLVLEDYTLLSLKNV